ncbi:hypothetical protein K6119_18010 [Paracrocinitomix mangrovi]|uniref:hypothetical protein n=1 Tax=Paracrocinitomix mangrovi TaxID=2862509 RepID=UPI001C8E6334|nr:hypothetical protein [Paracrocinitomix mangrovi]UKN01620.1 hypothetical protein K6119_18010 [Paracrocinitomix mangrovi]
MKVLTFAVAICSSVLLSSFTLNNDPVKENDYTNIVSSKSEVKHCIQLCSYSSSVPISVAEKLMKLGNVTSLKSEEGSIYVTAPYHNEQEALNALPKMKELGFEQAEAVVLVEDQLLTLDDYHAIEQENKKSNADKKYRVIRIWK